MKLKIVSWFVSHHCYHKCLYACFFFFQIYMVDFSRYSHGVECLLKIYHVCLLLEQKHAEITEVAIPRWYGPMPIWKLPRAQLVLSAPGLPHFAFTSRPKERFGFMHRRRWGTGAFVVGGNVDGSWEPSKAIVHSWCLCFGVKLMDSLLSGDRFHLCLLFWFSFYLPRPNQHQVPQGITGNSQL